MVPLMPLLLLVVMQVENLASGQGQIIWSLGGSGVPYAILWSRYPQPSRPQGEENEEADP